MGRALQKRFSEYDLAGNIFHLHHGRIGDVGQTGEGDDGSHARQACQLFLFGLKGQVQERGKGIIQAEGNDIFAREARTSPRDELIEHLLDVLQTSLQVILFGSKTSTIQV